MANRREGPRLVAAGAECEDDPHEGNPFYVGSDDDDCEIAVVQVSQNTANSRGCTWGMLTEEGTEEDLLFGSRRTNLDAAGQGWGRNSEGDRSTRLEWKRREDQQVSSDDENDADPNADRHLKKFLKNFAMKDAYALLRQEGFTLEKTLRMREDDLLAIGFDGEEKLLFRRRLMFAINQVHTFEWISQETLRMTEKLLQTARRLTNPVVSRHTSDNAVDTPDGPVTWADLRKEVDRSLGSVQQQAIGAKEPMAFMASAVDQLRKMTEKVLLQNESSNGDLDLEESLINFVDLANVSDGLRKQLMALRKTLLSGEKKESL